MMVSVCMATYNGEKYLAEQIDSILPQLQQGDELIISDDGSTDRTMGIILTYSDARIKVFNSNKKDIIRNFENALMHAKGDIVFLADQDDIWHPKKVEECLKYLSAYDLVLTNLEVFSNDVLDTRLFFNNKGTKTGIVRNIIKNNYIGAAMAFKRQLLEKALPFPEGINMHDTWLALVAEITGKTFYIDKPLIYYRRHEANASETGEKSSNSFLKKISIRWLYIYNLAKRFL